LTTPLDVVKTRMQTSPEKYSKGALRAASDIVASEGVGALLTGLSPTVVGYGLEGTLKFGFYETFKVLLKNATPFPLANFLLASVVAGAVASVVLCPMEETRIKMVGDPSWAREGLISGMARLVRDDGMFATLRGLGAMLTKQVPYTMGKQVTFDFAARMLYACAVRHALRDREVKMAVSFSAAFVASIVACLLSQPGDMILTATYKQTDSQGLGGVIREIYRKRGLAGFFLGTSARLAHVASIVTTQLVLYDMIKVVLGLPLTGGH